MGTTGSSTDVLCCARYSCRPAQPSLLPTTRSGEEEAEKERGEQDVKYVGSDPDAEDVCNF